MTMDLADKSDVFGTNPISYYEKEKTNEWFTLTLTIMGNSQSHTCKLTIMCLINKYFQGFFFYLNIFKFRKRLSLYTQILIPTPT